ncbi:MAG: hypothetical protein K8L99_06755 [Anaerolineae bacterium]|nr:hypothetical protein [Anaerolineae bacterium]
MQQTLSIQSRSRINYRPFIWLFVVSFILMLPLLLQPTFHRGADIETHIYNTTLFGREFTDGVIYPRWLGDLYWGYGSPSGMLSKVTTYYASGLLTVLGLSPIVALKIVIWATLFGSGCAMYWLAMPYLPPTATLTAAIFYQLAPYAMIDLYSRMALPEYMSFLWLPLLFGLLINCIERKSLLYPVLFAICFTAQMLTHFLIAYLTGLTLALLGLYQLWRVRENLRGPLLRVVLAGLLTLGLSAFYVLPLLVENQFLNVQWFTQGILWGDYRNNFLLNASAYNGTDFEAVSIENTIIGISALFGIGVAVIVAFANLCYPHHHPSRQRNMALVMLVVFAVATFMSFSLAQPLYRVIPQLNLLQFPWRWQTIATVAVAYLVGEGITWLKDMPRRKTLKFATQILIALLILQAFYSIFIIYINISGRGPIKEENLQEVLGQRPIENSFVFRTFLPRWAAEVDFATLPRPNPQVTSENPADINIEIWRSPRRVFTVQSESANTITLHTFWFPGWQITVNGEAITPDIQPQTGLMQIPLPAGESNIMAIFGDTPIRSAGKVISLLTLLGVIVIGAYSLRTAQRQTA